jgi:Tol biopolymer transport system component
MRSMSLNGIARNPCLGLFATLIVALAAGKSSAQPIDPSDPLRPWTEGVKVHPVSSQPDRHTIHSYYVCNPESPDGRRVVFYASRAANGHVGEICMLDRSSGAETLLVENVNVEDAHRAACQQWISAGKRVALHNLRDGHWQVIAVDADSRTQRVLAVDRQLAFGQSTGELLPIYGCHWKPGQHRDLELVNAATGDIRTVLKAEAVQKIYGPWLEKEFGGKPISIFFPVLSPDSKRVFFKIAAGSGGDDFRSSKASHRQGLIGYDLDGGQFLFMRERWGHPAWHPDSRHIIEMGNLLIDSDGGSYARIPDEPQLRGCHPSVSPDGKLFVVDGILDSLGGKPGEWSVVVGDMRGHRYQVLHTFDNSHGARSWRTNHPHPAFSADGRRIYFNVNSGEWTQLFVAEAGL